MKTSTVVFGSIVVAGAGVQGAPFFGIPSDLSLSGLIGRGLSADSHNPESKPALIAHKHVEPKEHKGDEARKTDHKKAEHGEKFSEDKDRGLAVNLGMNMGMCANVIVNGVLTQDCSTRNTKQEDSKHGDHHHDDHGHGSEAGHGKPKGHTDQPKNNDAQCHNTVVNMKIKLQTLQSDNDHLRGDVSNYKRKVAEYEQRLAIFEQSRNDKKNLVARDHRSSSGDFEHGDAREHKHRDDHHHSDEESHHSSSSSIHTGGGLRIENHHSESHGTTHDRDDHHHKSGQRSHENYQGNQASHHRGHHDSGFGHELGRDERYLANEFRESPRESSHHGDKHRSNKDKHRPEEHDNYHHFDNALFGERGHNNKGDNESYGHGGRKHGNDFDELREFYHPSERDRNGKGERDSHRSNSRGYLGEDFFDHSSRDGHQRHHNNKFGKDSNYDLRRLEDRFDEERGPKHYDTYSGQTANRRGQDRGYNSLGQELDEWYGTGARRGSDGSPRSSQSYRPLESEFDDDRHHSGFGSGRNRHSDRGYSGKGLKGSLQPFEDEFEGNRGPNQSNDRNGSSDRGNNNRRYGLDDELEEWYGSDRNGSDRYQGERGSDRFDYNPFERESTDDRSKPAKGGEDRSNRGFRTIEDDVFGSGNKDRSGNQNTGKENSSGKSLGNLEDDFFGNRGQQGAHNSKEKDGRNKASGQGPLGSLDRQLESNRDSKTSPKKGSGRDGIDDDIKGLFGSRGDSGPEKSGSAHNGNGGGLSHDLQKGGKALGGGLAIENGSNGGKESSGSHSQHKDNGLKGGLRKEGEFYGKGVKEDKDHIKDVLQNEGNFWDKSLKKDGKHVDNGAHKAGNGVDEGLHQKGAKIDKGLQTEGKKIDKGVHSGANDVDDDMHEDGKKIDYRLHDYGNELLNAKHEVTSGGSSEKTDNKQQKEQGQKDDGSILKEWFGGADQKDSNKPGSSKQAGKEDAEDPVFKPKTVHIGIPEESLKQI